MVTDTIADVLTRIRNAQRVGHSSVNVPVSKVAAQILSVLKDEGFIESFDESKIDGSIFSNYQVALKYYDTGLPLISTAKRVSKPGRRIYVGLSNLPKVAQGVGISIISTSKGVVSDTEARRLMVGGELLATVS